MGKKENIKKTAANTYQLDTTTYKTSSDLKSGTATVTLSSGYGTVTVSGFLATQNVVASYKPAAAAYTSSLDSEGKISPLVNSVCGLGLCRRSTRYSS